MSISPPSPIQGTIRERLQINCTVSTVSGVDSSSVLVIWTRPGGGSEGGPVINDSRVNISPTTSSGNNYTSIVQFTYLMEGDEGTYTCNVMILESSGSQSVQLQLFPSKLSLTYGPFLLCIVYLSLTISVIHKIYNKF